MSDANFRTTFARNLKRQLQISGKTQSDLINDLGLSSSTVSNWCTAQKMPRIEKIQLLADYFGIDKSELIEDSVKVPDSSINFIAFDDGKKIELESLPQEARDDLVKYVEFLRMKYKK